MLSKLEQFKLDVLKDLRVSELTESGWYNGIHELGFEFIGYEVWLNISNDNLLELLDIESVEESTFKSQENLDLIALYMSNKLDDVSIYYYEDSHNNYYGTFRHEILDDSDLYDMLLKEFREIR